MRDPQTYMIILYFSAHRKKMYFFYINLINRKFQKPCYQTYLSKELHIDSNSSWKKIYKCKLTDIEDQKIAEFNYKLLNNFLCNNLS